MAWDCNFEKLHMTSGLMVDCHPLPFCPLPHEVMEGEY